MEYYDHSCDIYCCCVLFTPYQPTTKPTAGNACFNRVSRILNLTVSLFRYALTIWLVLMMKATGGTPITTWLPNNLFSTLEYMQTVIHNIDSKVASDPLNASDVEAYADIKHRAMSRLSTLEKEVIDLQSDFDERQELEEFETRQH
eukprot:m.250443 g.250443  ORF g.250443 m.250443 type:complete len:146 (+) comp15435_c0_seq2:1720-2157(+)